MRQAKTMSHDITVSVDAEGDKTEAADVALALANYGGLTEDVTVWAAEGGVRVIVDGGTFVPFEHVEGVTVRNVHAMRDGQTYVGVTTTEDGR